MKNDILVTSSSETLNEVGYNSIYLHDNEVYLNSFCFILRSKTNFIIPEYINWLLKNVNYRKKIMNEGQGSTRYNLSRDRYLSICVKIPSIKVQFFVAKFLSLLDKQIELYVSKLALTKMLKNVFIESFFKNRKEKIKFQNFVIRNSEKNKNNDYDNVVTISNKYGFINQKDYFLENTNIASKDKRNYIVLRKKAFGFNPSRINVGSFGYYDSNEIGLFSPIYISFYIDNNFYVDEIILLYSKTTDFRNQINKWETGSVRKGIKFDDLLNFEIPNINLLEQKEFVNKAKSIKYLIKLLNDKIEILKKIRKFYLENLFI